MREEEEKEGGRSHGTIKYKRKIRYGIRYKKEIERERRGGGRGGNGTGGRHKEFSGHFLHVIIDTFFYHQLFPTTSCGGDRGGGGLLATKAYPTTVFYNRRNRI
jgi:hypothetical protein